MEDSRRTLIARVLAALLLLAAGALAWTEKNSAVSAAVRGQTPTAAWVSLGGASYLAVYQPGQRALDLIYFGQKITRAKAQAAAQQAAPAISWPAYSFDLGKDAPASPDPALALKDALLARMTGLSFWRELLPGLRSPSSQFSRFDRMLLALELHRLEPADVRCAWAPEEAQLQEFLNLRLSRPQPDARPLTVEVLNATGEKGVASQATKVLRSKDVDVVFFGNTAVQNRTLIYDRTGRFDNARRIRRLLDCPSAEILTQMNLKKIVDATIVLAPDCPAEGGRRGLPRRAPWN